MNWLLSIAAGFALLSFPLARSGYLGLSVRLLGFGVAGTAIARERGMTLPTFKNSRVAELEAQVTALQKQLPDPAIGEPPADWLEVIARECHHFRINGETGSGKSTFTDNLINLLSTVLGGIEPLLIDPKYPLSEWQIEPAYKGIDEALDGLQWMADEIETRLSLARQDKESGREIRRFSPLLVIIDEIDWVISKYGNDARDLLRIGLKVGRALNVKLCYVGQTPLCSRLKLNRDDFRHSANFYLGENVKPAIDEVGLSNDQKTNLGEQYALRQAKKQRYFCLVKYPASPPFITTLPKPGAFVKPSLNPVVEPSPKSEPSDALSILRTQTRQGFPVLPVEPEATPEPPNRETDELAERVRELHARGVRTVKAIAWEIAEIKPSRSARYRELSERIKAILTSLE